ALQQNDWTMSTLRKLRGLRKQPSVHQRDGEIRIRLPLDHNAPIEAVIADGQSLHADIEVGALAGETNQRGRKLRRIDQELMTRALAAGSNRGLAMFYGIDGTLRACRIWRHRFSAKSIDDNGIVVDRLSTLRGLAAESCQVAASIPRGGGDTL